MLSFDDKLSGVLREYAIPPQLHVLAQVPVTPDGMLCPVMASDVQDAIRQAEKVLGVALNHLGGNRYTDGIRQFELIFGDALAKFTDALDQL